MDQDTRDKVIHKMTTERDLRNQMAYARQEAIEEGIAEGLAKGIEEGLAKGLEKGIEEGLAKGLAKGDLDRAIKVATQMLADGMPIDKIAKYTELSHEQIVALKD